MVARMTESVDVDELRERVNFAGWAANVRAVWEKRGFQVEIDLVNRRVAISPEGLEADEAVSDSVAVAWIHLSRVNPLVGQAVNDALSYPRHDLTLEIRHPSEADGCWCYAHGKGLDARPHPHNPGLRKCPPSIAHDNYVLLRMSE